MFMVEKGLKVLFCVFVDDVSCKYRKSAKFYVMRRCWECRHFKRSNREMLEVDEKVMDEIDEEHRTGVSE
jgi:hypothetical protein